MEADVRGDGGKSRGPGARRVRVETPVAGRRPSMNGMRRRISVMRRVRRAAVMGVAAQDVLHLILQQELAFLQSDFFELFGFGEIVAGRQVVDLFVEDVMLAG